MKTQKTRNKTKTITNQLLDYNNKLMNKTKSLLFPVPNNYNVKRAVHQQHLRIPDIMRLMSNRISMPKTDLGAILRVVFCIHQLRPN